MSELKPPSIKLLDPYTGQEKLALYSAKVVVSGGAAGHGRASGKAISADGNLQLDLRLPKELGGQGGGTNPEQLFAAGFAACFHGALTLVAAKHGLRLPADSQVSAVATFGRDPKDGLFYLDARIEVQVAGMDAEVLNRLIAETETICPYAKISRTGFDLTVVGV